MRARSVIASFPSLGTELNQASGTRGVLFILSARKCSTEPSKLNMAEKEFRKLVLSLSQQLVVAETNQIVYLYHLPLEFSGKQPLTVLQSMHSRDIFSANKPDGLANAMKEVNRMDLVKLVKDYTRNTKQRRTSKLRPNSDKTSALPDESEPSFHTSLQAKLEVADIQSTITADSLARALDMVKGTQLKRVEEIMLEAKTCSDRLSKLLKRAQTLYRLSAAGSGSTDEETPAQQPNSTLLTMITYTCAHLKIMAHFSISFS